MFLLQHSIRSAQDPMSVLETRVDELLRFVDTTTSHHSPNVLPLQLSTISSESEEWSLTNASYPSVFRTLLTELVHIFIFSSIHENDLSNVGSMEKKSTISHHHDKTMTTLITEPFSTENQEHCPQICPTISLSSSTINPSVPSIALTSSCSLSFFSSYFILLERMVITFQQLIQLSRRTPDHLILSASLSLGKQFIDIFVRSAIPRLQQHFKTTHRDAILQLFRLLQQSTRNMQMLCTHCKDTKDLELTIKVPPTKKALETLVFKVKAMLEANQCAGAFWMGNLKHRNLAGKEIPSQISPSSCSSSSSPPRLADPSSDKQLAEMNDEQVQDSSNPSELSSSSSPLSSQLSQLSQSSSNEDDQNPSIPSPRLQPLEEISEKGHFLARNKKRPRKSHLSSMKSRMTALASQEEETQLPITGRRHLRQVTSFLKGTKTSTSHSDISDNSDYPMQRESSKVTLSSKDSSQQESTFP